MRSRLTSLLAVGFLSVGTAAALAWAGGEHFGFAAKDGRSASFSQYRPPETPPVSVPPTTGPPATTPPVPTPPVPTPPASQFRPTPPSARVSSRGAVTVRCATACHIVLRARHGRHRIRIVRTLHGQGTASLHLSKQQLRRLGRGKLVLTIEVNGKVVATRTVRA
jgi:hypothetical protein